MTEDEAEFVLQRGTVEEGRSFSEEAMSAFLLELTQWIVGRVLARWDATDEPPTVLRASVVVEVR